MRTGTGSGATGLEWLIDDQLGSTAITADGATGAKLSELRYKPWGELRYIYQATLTDRRYTGQQAEGIGLYDYGARWFDVQLGRFVQADTVVPNMSDPQAWDRYAYVDNNPVKFVDPTGHMLDQGGGASSMGDDWWKKRQEKLSKINNDSFYFDTQKLANKVLPNTNPARLQDWATKLDEIALGIDAISESIVAGYPVVGFAGTSFEGTPVAGPAGAGAGWILGETNPIVQNLINAGNLVASSSSALSILSDMKQGNTRAFGEISLNSQGLAIDYNQSISTSSYTSFALSSIGWAARIVEISIFFQSAAVANDRGFLPSINIPSHFNFKFP